MREEEVRHLVSKIVAELAEKNGKEEKKTKAIPMEISARHVHLSKEDVALLFGKGYALTPKKMLSQPGEFLSNERVKLVTAKGEIANVAVLGPERKSTQVELSATDCKALGIHAPANMSGDLNGAGDVFIVSQQAVVQAREKVIIAKAHIHMTPSDASVYGVKDGQLVCVKVETKRPVTFENIVIRVNDKFQLAMHVDFDEANACCMTKDTMGRLIV